MAPARPSPDDRVGHGEAWDQSPDHREGSEPRKWLIRRDRRRIPAARIQGREGGGFGEVERACLGAVECRDSAQKSAKSLLDLCFLQIPSRWIEPGLGPEPVSEVLGSRYPC